MKIIFLGTTGVHHGLIGANIYLNRLNKSEFAFVEGFCDVAKDESGFPIYIDDDENGNQIYTMGAGKDVLMVKKSIEDLVSILGCSSSDLLVKPVSIKGERMISFISKIPGILGGSHINLFISNLILKREFHSIFEDVEKFRAELNHG